MAKSKKKKSEQKHISGASALFEAIAADFKKANKGRTKREKELLDLFGSLDKNLQKVVFELIKQLSKKPKVEYRGGGSPVVDFRSVDCPVGGPGTPGWSPGPGGM